MTLFIPNNYLTNFIIVWTLFYTKLSKKLWNDLDLKNSEFLETIRFFLHSVWIVLSFLKILNFCTFWTKRNATTVSPFIGNNTQIVQKRNKHLKSKQWVTWQNSNFQLSYWIMWIVKTYAFCLKNLEGLNKKKCSQVWQTNHKSQNRTTENILRL